MRAKRRHALCVRYRTKQGGAKFWLKLQDEWIKALALHCRVSVIEEDFDYEEACDRLRPDFTIFECWRVNRPLAIEIKNPGAHPQIPRIAFDPGDCFSPQRATIAPFLDRLGLDRIFSYGHDHFLQSPEWSGRMYAATEIFDPGVFIDRRVDKNIPVNVFGGLWSGGLYQWRVKCAQKLLGKLPVLLYEHPGYGTNPAHPFAVEGKHYAKLLSQSHFTLVDTTPFDKMVRKHLEAPGAGSVLVAPPSAGLAARGFVDMENCLMATEDEVVDKINAVYRDPALYEKIRRAGHDLVHARYTPRQWRSFLDWYECTRSLRPGEIAQQQGLIGGFAAVPDLPGTPSVAGWISPPSEYSAILTAATSLIWEGGNLDEAESLLRRIAAYGPVIREMWLPLGIIALLRGSPDKAKEYFLFTHNFLLRRDGMSQLDPAEVAWLLLVGVMQRDLTLVAAMAEQALTTRHLALRRMQWLMAKLLNQPADPAEGMIVATPGDRLSVHWMQQDDLGSWLTLINRILAANNLPGLGGNLRNPG